MSADFIPGADAAFDTWQANFMSVVGANPTAYGLVASDLVPASALQLTWAAAYPAHITAQAAAQAARQTKDAARTGYEPLIRGLAKRIQAQPPAIVTDAERAAAGLTVPDSNPTPVGPPTTAPTATIDTAQRLQHTVHFRDSTTPNSKAKPAGVRGCEIWMKIGTPPPADPSELSFVTLDSRTPNVVHFDGADAGKVVTYWLRWVSTRDEKGPWSAAVAATVPG